MMAIGTSADDLHEFIAETMDAHCMHMICLTILSLSYYIVVLEEGKASLQEYSTFTCLCWLTLLSSLLP
jgi:hypothetical protein